MRSIRMHSTKWRVMMLLMAVVMMGVSYAPIGTSSVVKAGGFDECKIAGLTSLVTTGETTMWNDAFSFYRTFGSGVPIDPCGAGEGTYIRVETWIDGQQYDQYCESPSVMTTNGACTAVTPAGSSAQAGMGYNHGTPFTGVWCATSHHVFVATTNQSFYNSSNSCLDAGPGEEEEEEEQDECSDPSECNQSPIVMPLTNAQAFKLTSPAEGVLFDLDADGAVEQTAWTAADSKLAFLAIDRNGDGFINNGSELFGNHTLPNIRDGFRALRFIMPQGSDSGGEGRIDSNDPVFSKLLLWEDRDHNGISSPDELRPLGELYSTIGLGYNKHNRKDGIGNEFRYRGWALFRTAPGANRALSRAEEKSRQRNIYDVFFAR